MIQPFYEIFIRSIGVLIIFDITNEESFNSIKSWIAEVENYANEHIRMILVGNKVDISHERYYI